LCRHATAKGEAPWPKEAWGANYCNRQEVEKPVNGNGKL